LSNSVDAGFGGANCEYEGYPCGWDQREGTLTSLWWLHGNEAIVGSSICLVIAMWLVTGVFWLLIVRDN